MLFNTIESWINHIMQKKADNSSFSEADFTQFSKTELTSHEFEQILSDIQQDTYSGEPFAFDSEKATQKRSLYQSVTEDQIEKLIDSAIVQEFLFHSKQLVISYKLPSGFCIIGTSSVVDPRKFNLTMGREYCREQAINKLWELEGYLLQDSLQN